MSDSSTTGTLFYYDSGITGTTLGIIPFAWNMKEEVVTSASTVIIPVLCQLELGFILGGVNMYSLASNENWIIKDW